MRSQPIVTSWLASRRGSEAAQLKTLLDRLVGPLLEFVRSAT